MKTLILIFFASVTAFGQITDFKNDILALPESTLVHRSIWVIDTVSRGDTTLRSRTVQINDVNELGEPINIRDTVLTWRRVDICTHAIVQLKERLRYANRTQAFINALPPYRRNEHQYLIMCSKCGLVLLRTEVVSERWLSDDAAIIQAMKLGLVK